MYKYRVFFSFRVIKITKNVIIQKNIKYDILFKRLII